jgi:mono/diheme cytochrome c family protein
MRAILRPVYYGAVLALSYFFINKSSCESKILHVTWPGATTHLVASFALFVLAVGSTSFVLGAQKPERSAQEVLKNPYSGQRKAAKAGRKLYERNCARCHGKKGEGTPNVPALAGGATQSIPDGLIYSYITRGDVGNGMPSWASLPTEQRWQVITYLKSLPDPPKPRT